MIYIKDLTTKQIIILSLAAIVFVTTVGIYLYKVSNKEIENDVIELGLMQNVEEPEELEKIKQQIMIHVTGAVKNAGVIVLDEGNRVLDAIEACGGESEDADLNKINLAYVLHDGDKLYIPSTNDNEEVEYISTESGDNVIEKGVGGIMEEQTNIVNINTATKEQLKALSGIGDSTAEKIIAYRNENGKFQTIEDLKKVPGIGDSKFNAIKDNIKV